MLDYGRGFWSSKGTPDQSAALPSSPTTTLPSYELTSSAHTADAKT